MIAGVDSPLLVAGRGVDRIDRRVVATDENGAIDDSRRGADAVTGVERPLLVAGCSVQRIQAAVVAADKDRSVGDCWRCVDVSPCFGRPLLVAGCSVQCVDVAIPAANKDRLIDDGRRGCNSVVSVDRPPLPVAWLCTRSRRGNPRGESDADSRFQQRAAARTIRAVPQRLMVRHQYSYCNFHINNQCSDGSVSASRVDHRSGIRHVSDTVLYRDRTGVMV